MICIEIICMDKNNFKKIPQHLGKVAGPRGNLPIFAFLSSWVSSVKNIGYPVLQNRSEHFSWFKNYPSGTLAKVLKEPLLLQKQVIIHMKALSLRYQVPDRQGPGIILGAPFQFSLKSILSRKSGCGNPMIKESTLL